MKEQVVDRDIEFLQKVLAKAFSKGFGLTEPETSVWVLHYLGCQSISVVSKHYDAKPRQVKQALKEIDAKIRKEMLKDQPARKASNSTKKSRSKEIR